MLLGELLTELDRTVGRGRVLVVLTADHGTTVTPEKAPLLGMTAARIGKQRLIDLVQADLPPAVRVLSVDAPAVYLTPTLPGVDRLALQRKAALALARDPDILEAYAPEDVARFPEPYATFYARSLYRGRRPDVQLRARPHAYISRVDPEGRGAGTGHGAPYLYDQAVPVILAAPGRGPRRAAAGGGPLKPPRNGTTMRFDSSRPLLLLPALALALFASPARAQSGTSSTAYPLPGEGGPLPRAPMPEGGVDDGSQDALTPKLNRVGPEGGVDAEHCHEHEHDGVAHSHCHDHEAGPRHEHWHDAKDSPEHCHEHAHDGSAHSHCHDHAAGPAHAHPHPHAAAPAPDAAPGKHASLEPQRAGDAFGSLAEEQVVGGIAIRWNGYVRLLAEVVENDSKSAFIGRNDGFKLGNARLGIQARKGDFSGYVSMEAAAGERETFNDPNAELRVMPRDMYLRYDVSRFARVTAGRFKTPYDLSSLEATALRTFIEQPVESRGVLPTQGFELNGMATDRQLGVMIHAERMGFDAAGFDLGYSIALTNGFTRNLAFNDNDRPAAFARLSGYYGDWVALNLAGFADTRTTGDLPNLFDEDVKGVEVSALGHIGDLRLEALFVYQNAQFETSGRPDVNAMGGHAQFAYELWNIGVAYRFAFFDPNLDDIEDADRVIEHTLGLGYSMDSLPLRFLLNGTVVQEQAGRKLSNNRLTLLAQFTF